MYNEIPFTGYTEGKVYTFKVVKQITMPDNCVYWVLEGPDSSRFLIDAEIYNKYGIAEEDNLRCNIDRVNCSGRVFLEPQSELKTGEVYSFNITGIINRLDPIGRIRYFALVETSLGTSYCELDHNKHYFSEELECRVRCVRKGHALLEQAINPKPVCRQGTWEEMLVISSYHYYNGEHCYLLQDSYGNGHVVPFTSYRKFGLRTGVWSDFFIVSVNPDESCIIEPRHPCYKEGDTCVFTVKDRSLYTEFQKVKGSVLQLEDERGYEGIAFVSQDKASEYPNGSSVRGEIVKFKNGKPVIEMLTYKSDI
jgi:hypothetical protein